MARAWCMDDGAKDAAHRVRATEQPPLLPAQPDTGDNTADERPGTGGTARHRRPRRHTGPRGPPHTHARGGVTSVLTAALPMPPRYAQKHCTGTHPSTAAATRRLTRAASGLCAIERTCRQAGGAAPPRETLEGLTSEGDRRSDPAPCGCGSNSPSAALAQFSISAISLHLGTSLHLGARCELVCLRTRLAVR